MVSVALKNLVVLRLTQNEREWHVSVTVVPCITYKTDIVSWGILKAHITKRGKS